MRVPLIFGAGRPSLLPCYWHWAVRHINRGCRIATLPRTRAGSLCCEYQDNPV